MLRSATRRITNPAERGKLFFWKAGGAANKCSENKTRSIKNAAERGGMGTNKKKP
jgi:hypothetical protein